jgi:Dolichyl-phosphate-mannose-protein mannosyltransferase
MTLLLDRPATAPARTVPRVGERARTAIVLVVALLGSLWLRLLYLHTPLGIDEGGVAFIARAWGTGHGSLYGAYWLDRPPLLVALYKVAVLGGPTGIRVLGALAAVALVGTTSAVAYGIAGHRAARLAALLSAVLAGSVALLAVFTPAELLAAVPAAGSIGCLVATHRRREARWLVGAGLLAVSAVLIKQSFLDAGFAGLVFLLASSVRDRRPHLRRATAYLAGALIPLAFVGVWLAVAHLSPGSLAYALFGFRLEALHTLSSLPLQVRARNLIQPGESSGLFFALLAGLGAFWILRRDGVLAATLAAWVVAGAAGVLGGGTYWAHYLIQLIAPASVLAATALARVPGRSVLVAALAATAIAGTVRGVPQVQGHQAHLGVLSTARYLRTHARPGDTQYVMWARANVAYYSGLPSPYPYAWSLLVRAHPGASARLLRLLRSPQRPTWIVGWQPPDAWQLDPNGAIAAALHRHYRVVAHRHGHPIYHRRSSSP